MATNKLTSLMLKRLGKGKHFDGAGLYIHVQAEGTGYWRLKYRFNGLEKAMSFGIYPEVSLAEARDRRDGARSLLRNGKDPMAERKAARASFRRSSSSGFPSAANAWLAFKAKGWKPATQRKANYVVESYLIPALKNQSIAALTSRQASDALIDIFDQAPTLASKARQYLNDITYYAIRQGWREEGHTLNLKGALPKHTKGHLPALTDLNHIPELLGALNSYPSIVVRNALKTALLTVQRPNEIVTMQWDHIDMERGLWTIPANLMKMEITHTVPLSRQALEILRELLPYSAGKTYVFPPLARQKTEHLHRDSLSKALREMGFGGKHTPHGFRAMFRTIAREQLGVDPDILETQLAHAKKGEVQSAYDRTQFIEKRQRVMQRWADYLDNFGSEDNIVPLVRKFS